jgi:hypothetical protein
MHEVQVDVNNQLGVVIRKHEIEPGVLPLAPRQPFCRFSESALSDAANYLHAFPEKRGVLSHVVRDLGRVASPAVLVGAVTMEAHFDSVAISDELADEILRLGFEPDGFSVFVPEHFSEHFTLKFKYGSETNVERRRYLWATIDTARRSLADLIGSRWPKLDCYIECELYPAGNRRTWRNSSLRTGWEDIFPIERDVVSGEIPRSEQDAALLGVPISELKRADIHVKFFAGMEPMQKDQLARRLASIGFYRVLTWAGNDICTGQFTNSRKATAVFEKVTKFFDEAGGCSELTLEHVPRVWRNRWPTEDGLVYASMPPIIRAPAAH